MTGPIGGAAQTTSTPRNRAGVRIHYWIDHACEFEENNGIQRVCRYLARGLEERGEQLVFRKWSDRKHRSTLCSRRQLRKFSRWHGPRLRNGSTPIGPERWLD